MTGSDNPFELSTAPVRRRPMPPLRVWLSFAIQRLLMHVVIPLLYTLLFLVAPQLDSGIPWILGPIVGLGASLLWLPTTIAITWARFLDREEDEHAVLLMNGELMSRRAFRTNLWARTGERLIGLVLIATLAVLPPLLHWTLSPLSLLAIPVIAWIVYFGFVYLRVGEATIATCSEQPHRVVALLEPLLRHRILAAWAQDGARSQLANAHIRLGNGDTALALLRGMKRPVPYGADLQEAMFLLGRGELDRARALVQTSTPRSVGQQVAYQVLAGLTDLHDDRPEAVLERAAEWSPLRSRLAARNQASLDLLAAAAHQALDDHASARVALATSGVSLEDRRWMEQAWPKWWQLLQAIEP